MLLTPINLEVICLFPANRGAHFLSHWHRRSEVKEEGRQSVSHEHPSALSHPLQSLPVSAAFFILFHINSSSCLCNFHPPPPSLLFPSLVASLLLICSPSPQANTHQSRPDYITHSASQIKLPWTKQSNKK